MANNEHLMNTYAPLAVTFDHGDGVYLYDTHGKQYLDAVAGIAVCGLGHAHPVIARTVAEQAGKLIHTSNLYQIEKQRQLADRLFQLSGLDRVFFSNSGAEANEAAIKLARLYGHSRKIKTPTIVVMEKSFHGRTMATLTATGSRKVQAGFEPLLTGFVRIPYNNIEALEKISNNRNIVAVMVEPIQGESGVRVPDHDYLNKLRAVCDTNHWLLILDEIQTGMGRTGKWFAFQHNNIQPDIMTLAKSLGNGVPIGACLASEQVASVMKPGRHGSTFGGNPLACAAALAVIETIEADHLVGHAEKIGGYMLQGLKNALGSIRGVRDIRGYGLMLGIELDRPCAQLAHEALEQGLLINVTADNVVRLLPPLIINKDQADTVIDKTSRLIIALLEKEAA